MTTEDTNTGETTSSAGDTATTEQAAPKAAVRRDPTSLGEALAALQQG
jgi:hypothetical protein